jgi:transcriptional regulator with XRE-family HTH domain
MQREEQEPIPGIARNLARLMAARRLSVVEISRASEISEARIEQILANDAEPTASELLRLAGAMEVPMSAILAGISWESDGKGGGSFREEGS